MYLKRIIVAQVIIISALIALLVVYILYKYDKFNSQPSLLNTLSPKNAETLPMPGLLICTDSINLQINVTSGPSWPQKNTNFSMPTSDLFIEGVWNQCWTINTTEPIVYKHQPMEKLHAPSWNDLKIDITYLGGNGNILPQAPYAITLLKPLDNPDVQDLPWIYTSSLNKIRISYSVENRTYLNKQNEILFNNQLITETYSPEAPNGIEVRADPFLITQTEEYQAITEFSIITDILTFATSVLLTTYFILFGKGRFHPWGIMHYLLREKPKYTEIDNSQDTLMNVAVAYLDIKDIRGKDIEDNIKKY
ncbi:hypothetical protein C1645_751489 [Glomus cerebriforme]|uniref:Uncharacterized protein n=1 Tax=Glomus cerebriforme TaxID=658196 RepID=A0A397TK73_9GLOM|nr:hypothetical protein C1645_751489 [Glomus cerebriforme]